MVRLPWTSPAVPDPPSFVNFPALDKALPETLARGAGFWAWTLPSTVTALDLELCFPVCLSLHSW